MLAQLILIYILGPGFALAQTVVPPAPTAPPTQVQEDKPAEDARKAYDKIKSVSDPAKRIQIVDDVLGHMHKKLLLTSEEVGPALEIRNQSCGKAPDACFDMSRWIVPVCKTAGWTNTQQLAVESVLNQMKTDDNAQKIVAGISSCEGLESGKVRILESLIPVLAKKKFNGALLKLGENLQDFLKKQDAVNGPPAFSILQMTAEQLRTQKPFPLRSLAALHTQTAKIYLSSQPKFISEDIWREWILGSMWILEASGQLQLVGQVVQKSLTNPVKPKPEWEGELTRGLCNYLRFYNKAAECSLAIKKLHAADKTIKTALELTEIMALTESGQNPAAHKKIEQLKKKYHARPTGLSVVCRYCCRLCIFKYG